MFYVRYCFLFTFFIFYVSLLSSMKYIAKLRKHPKILSWWKSRFYFLKLLHRKYDEQDVSGMLSRFQHLCLMPIITSLHKYDYIMETTCKANWIDFRNIHFWSYDRGFRQNSAKSFLGLSWAYICQKFTPSYDRIQIIILQKTILI